MIEDNTTFLKRSMIHHLGHGIEVENSFENFSITIRENGIVVSTLKYDSNYTLSDYSKLLNFLSNTRKDGHV